MSDKKEMALHLRTGQGLALPLRAGPVRFAVINQNRLSSNAWRVWTERTGDAYIACRDNNMRQFHVSLHQSGQQQITCRIRTAEGVVENRKRWGQWHEPVHYGDPEIVPSFQLLFPNWALSLPYATRLANPGVWEKNVVFVETDDEYPMTVVGFYITNQEVSIAFGNTRPSYPLAVLPLEGRPGKKLWVIASQQPEGNLQEALKAAAERINQLAPYGERFEQLADGCAFSAFLNGHTDHGCQFGIVVPMTWRKRREGLGSSELPEHDNSPPS